MNELQSNKSTVLLVPQTVSAGATATANLDCKGQGSVEIIVAVGALAGGTNGDGPKTITIGEGDSTSAFTTITGLTASSSTLGASQSVRFFVDRKNGARKRYLRLTFSPETNDTNDNIPVCAIAYFDRSDADPASTSGYGSDLVKVPS